MFLKARKERKQKKGGKRSKNWIIVGEKKSNFSKKYILPCLYLCDRFLRHDIMSSIVLMIEQYNTWIKRPGEISQAKMLNPNIWKNKSNYMNFKHKSKSYIIDMIHWIPTYNKYVPLSQLGFNLFFVIWFFFLSVIHGIGVEEVEGGWGFVQYGWIYVIHTYYIQYTIQYTLH